MPTVNIRRELFESTMGKTYSEEELEKLCFQFGIEVEFYTEEEEKKII
jgi:phenylalanyl-tRNA synthetase beta chain